MWIEIVWSEQDEEHIARHGITRSEVDDALRSRNFGRRANHRYVVIGVSRHRTLVVVLERLAPGLRFGRVVTARLANESEKRLLHRRGKGGR